MTTASSENGLPAIVTMDMGYGHLRAALPLAQLMGTPWFHADREPLASPDEQRLWRRVRAFHENVSRLAQIPFLGITARFMMDQVTAIAPLHPRRDLSTPTTGVRGLERMIQDGLGRGLADYVKRHKQPLVSTFYAPAVAADRWGCEDVYCIVTDSDINRVWVPLEPRTSRIHYLAPAPRAVERLLAYGMPRSQVHMTGFPLPHSLLGGPGLEALKANLAARLVRLDRRRVFLDAHQGEVEAALGRAVPNKPSGPAHVLFAVGGAGAQAEMARQFLPTLLPLFRQRKLRMTLVAGARAEVAERFGKILQGLGLQAGADQGIDILYEPTLEAYFSRFEEVMAGTDVLWTKPSEMTFYGGLGVPLVFSDPVGVHERYNRRWALESGVGLLQRAPKVAGQWLAEWLREGTLAYAAWAGFRRMPQQGLYRIAERVRAR